jgi:Cu/Ag efflux pump CusA
VRGRDIGSFVNEAQMRIGREIALPVGYTIELGGQFEHLERAERRLQGVPKREAIEQARLARLKPVLMTGAVAALGFVPMLLATGVGAEVQRPLATVIVFGMARDTFLTMLALPVLYLLLADDRSLEGPHGVRYVRACGDL